MSDRTPMLSPRQRRGLKNGYFHLSSIARVDAVLRRLRSRDALALVLNFHEISPRRNPYRTPMTPEAFSELMEYLASKCHVCTFEELYQRSPWGSPKVVISFDDGFYDFVNYAMPILHRHRLRANQNVIAHSVATGEPPWIIRIGDALNAAGPKAVRALRVPGCDIKLEEDDDLAMGAYGRRLGAYLKSLVPAERRLICADIEHLLGEIGPGGFTRMMSAADVREAAAIHELGAHSYSHEVLSQLNDEEFAADVDRCDALFASLGLRMTIFAFPFGCFRAGQVEALQARGIEHVLLVGERPARIGDGVYTRITMYGDSAAERRLRALGLRPGRRPPTG